MLLEPTWEQLKANQMGSNPNANLNHHMKSYDQAPCEVTSPTDKAKLHDDFMELHVGCYSSPLQPLDLVPRSKHEKARDTQNGDDLHAPTLPPSPSDVPTSPSRT